MAIAWNEDDPRDAALLVQNLAQVLRQVARQASLRQPPTALMAQEWHRRVYAGARLPVSYYAGEIRDGDSRFPELYGYEVSIGALPGLASRSVPAALSRFEAAMQEAVAALEDRSCRSRPSWVLRTEPAQARALGARCAPGFPGALLFARPVAFPMTAASELTFFDSAPRLGSRWIRLPRVSSLADTAPSRSRGCDAPVRRLAQS